MYNVKIHFHNKLFLAEFVDYTIKRLTKQCLLIIWLMCCDNVYNKIKNIIL